jgi:hypothetical protein
LRRNDSSASERHAARSAVARSLLLLWVFVAMVGALPPLHAQTVGASIDGRPGAEAVLKALDAVKADPNLTPTRKIRTLQWQPQPGQVPNTGLPAWAIRLARWLAESTRVIVWGATIVAAILLAAYLVRVGRNRSNGAADTLSVTPTHVRELDIRPESLPTDIGATAQAMWDRGEQRLALALLYRGVLSRLVHVHRVPIRDSSTEGDCLQLTRLSAPTVPAEYAAVVILVWQRFVYGQFVPDDDRVRQLCRSFRSSLAPGGVIANGSAEPA